MRAWIIAALLVAPLALAARAAAPADDSQEGFNCANPTTQIEINICADKDYRRADDALNRAYKKAMADEDAHGRELLRTAERAWIRFRDAHCQYAASGSEGGSMHPMDYDNCVTELTDLRTKQLKEGR
ncbi:MAG TPA: lysozyme inhibitor LprI family protein [Rhizomicrobium sp.]|nr:lysozyme inhibitor LprI family protein [Rhizomicrobium sp.]